MRINNSEYAKALVRAATSQRGDAAESGYTCHDRDCGRTFQAVQALQEHAESVHTFDDIRRMLSEEIRDRYGVPYTSGNPGTYVWVEDLSVDWVVFSVEAPGDSSLQKASYVISADNTVTLGEPTEVIRRTVYDPVKSVSAE